MKLIEADEATALYDKMGPGVEISGGSAANTIVGVASLGGRGGLHRQGLRRPTGRGVPP